jgi:hypothetical protein
MAVPGIADGGEQCAITASSGVGLGDLEYTRAHRTDRASKELRIEYLIVTFIRACQGRVR